MPAVQKLSDETLKQYLSDGFSQSEIAKLCRVGESAISKRVKSLETRTAVKAPQHIVKAAESVFDTRTALEENYNRTLKLLDEDIDNFGDKIKVHAEIRNHLQFAMTVIEKLYILQETKSFMDEVMNILDECEPGSRDRILARLAEERTLRSAFLPHH